MVEAVKNVEAYLARKEKNSNAKADAPITNRYRTDTEATDELWPVDYDYYQLLIGILRWMVELGRFNICVEVSMISSCLDIPREGHLQQLFHIFSYLKKHHNTEMVFDTSVPNFGADKFQLQDWSQTMYGDSPPDQPPNIPKPRGQGFIFSAHVDSDHAGDTVTRRSRTGLFIYFNNALFYGMSKKQGYIDTSSFGSEFVSMRACTEYIRWLKFKLQIVCGGRAEETAPPAMSLISLS